MGGLPQDPRDDAESSIVTQTTSAFDLSALPTTKTDPALIADDERHFALIERSLTRSVDELSVRLAGARRHAPRPARSRSNATRRSGAYRRGCSP
jgi:hypothetical protein